MILGLENIRIFKNRTDLKFSPLTILIGSNNSGKSTFAKMIRLISNGIRKGGKGKVLMDEIHFSSEITSEIGDFKNIISRGSVNNEFTISFNDEASIPREVNYTPVEYLDHETSYTYSSDLIKGRVLLKQIEVQANYKSLLSFKRVPVDNLQKDFFKKKGAEVENLEFSSPFIWQLQLTNEQLRNIYDTILYYKKSDLGFIGNDSLKEFYDQAINIYELVTGYYDFSNRNRLFLIPSSFFHIVDNDAQFFKVDHPKGGEKDILKFELSKINVFEHNRFYEVYRDFELEIIRVMTESAYDNLYEIKTNKWINGVPKPVVECVESENIFEFVAERGVGKGLSDNDWLNKLEGIEHSFSKLFAKELKRNENSEWHLKRTINVDDLNQMQQRIARPNVFLKFVWHDFSPKFHDQKQVAKPQYFQKSIDGIDSPMFQFADKYSKGQIPKEGIQFINKWVKRLEIGDKLLIEPIFAKEMSIGYTYWIQDGDLQFELSENGHGIHKLMQILLGIAEYSQSLKEKETNVLNMLLDKYEFKGTYILEEPESNLHPSFQSVLADIIMEAMYEFEVNIIVESHSEYLIRKIQYLIASKESKLRNDHLSIFYLNNPKKIKADEDQIYQLKIREDGFMENDFGPGFFDEASNLKFELLKRRKLNLN